MGRTKHQTSTKDKNPEIAVIREWRFSMLGINLSGFGMDVRGKKYTNRYTS